VRTTQFIGLTAEAQRFVANLKELSSDNTTSGLCGEEIPLKRWKWPQDKLPIAVPERVEKACIREVVQEIPWSSGPMIFTCLEIDWGFPSRASDKKSNYTKVLQWVSDPRLGFRTKCEGRGPEYDVEKGIFWV